MGIERSRKLNSLTTMRFIAAGMIVVHHSCGNFGIPVDVAGRFLLDQAVSFFFILSGFILTYVYPSLDTWEARGRFWLARLGRVWPAHLAAFTLLWLVLKKPENFQTGVSTWWLGILNLMMVHAWVPVWNVFFSYNAVSWSISAEMFFYVVFPLLIIGWKKTWWWKVAAALCVAISMIWLCNWFNVLPPGEGKAWAVTTSGLVYIHPLARLFEFTLGMLTALVYRKMGGSIRMSSPNLQERTHWRKVLITAVELAAFGLVLLNMYEAQWLVLTLIAWAGPTAIEWAGHGPICSLAFAILIYVLAAEGGAISGLLGTLPAVLLGEISFSVYLLHQIMITWYQQNARQFESHPAWLLYAFFWSILLVGSWLVWAGVERPFRGWIVGLWPSPNSRTRIQGEVKPTSGFLHGLMAPSRLGLGLGALLLALLLIPVEVNIGHAAVNRNDQTAIDIVAAQSAKSAQSIRFGNIFELVGVQTESKKVGQVELKLAWRSIEKTELKYRVAVHFTDDSGHILGQADYEQDPNHENVAAGASWVDQVALTREKMKGVTWLGLVIYEKDKQTMQVTDARGGRVDYNGTRLLIPTTGTSLTQ